MDDFRGDFDEIANMMQTSWADLPQAPLLYTPAFLESALAYPGMSPALAPTMYRGGRAVAFVVGLPRGIRVDGEPASIVMVTFLTAAAEYKGAGYGIVIWSELVRRARAAGFDGMINYCVEGEPMDRMIVGACRRLSLPVTLVYSVGYLSRMLWPLPAGADVRQSKPPLDVFLELAGSLTESIPLARTWTREEAGWQLSRAGGVSESLTMAGRTGVVTGYVMEIANERRTKCLLADDVLWDDLHGEERDELVTRFLTSARAAGAGIAVVPQQRYADLDAFARSGFRPSSRVVHMYLTLWDRPSPVEPVSACYMDVV